MSALESSFGHTTGLAAGSLAAAARSRAAWTPRVVAVTGDPGSMAAMRLFLCHQPYDAEVMELPGAWGDVAELNPDVLVLDLDSDRDGLLRLAYALKKSVLGRFVPVVGIVADATAPNRRHEFTAGIDLWLAKPMTCDQLRLAVLAALRTRRNYRSLLERF